MKIKTKKTMNLPQLIEWAFNNPKEVESKIFESDNIDYFSNTAHVQFSNDGYGVRMDSSVTVDDTFTVTTEEEITEDTEIPKLMTTFKKTTLEGGIGYQRVRIDENYPIKLMLNRAESHGEPVEALHIVNDDSTHTLLWYDGKMVE